MNSSFLLSGTAGGEITESVQYQFPVISIEEMGRSAKCQMSLLLHDKCHKLEKCPNVSLQFC